MMMQNHKTSRRRIIAGVIAVVAVLVALWFIPFPDSKVNISAEAYCSSADAQESSQYIVELEGEQYHRLFRRPQFNGTFTLKDSAGSTVLVNHAKLESAFADTAHQSDGTVTQISSLMYDASENAFTSFTAALSADGQSIVIILGNKGETGGIAGTYIAPATDQKTAQSVYQSINAVIDLSLIATAP
ncbi:hypothetical protein [Bifidobacterium oedipodis]|uniref:Uncharacterized protein n=1 Tax=Bifidobacterium oedipodis TaxID=2675322 RepID=A0A7Y0ENQ9_9BIFI|nr:hypothetical protein [Bifidobacterium sp. DSM 109957]NMM93610.1 hypothetical protein [Bifidobacterium sp. DSM 109957]